MGHKVFGCARGRWFAGAALALSAGLFGVQGVGHVAAQAPQVLPGFTYPLVSTATNAPTAGTVRELPATSAAAVQGFAITLTNFAPNSSYNVQGCYSNPALLDTRSCISPAPATIKTDPSGNGSATVYFNTAGILGVIDTVTVTNAAKASDAYQSVVAGVIGYLPVVNVGLPNYIPPLFVPAPTS